ncbi:hypothetical protein [Macrococcus equipercicus]|uniref:Uncharacterized protein n=1 Tax=Macrococcus equipercicus TaxID=69967 RepID=A0A9Q9F278_9STAP|nr:hypothetical protein [Macrococcus equipercicus]UTH14742.1 hypothetical protein KFV11_05160 [Macrococcus equipercicus]
MLELKYKLVNRDGIGKSPEFNKHPGAYVAHCQHIDGLSQNIHTFQDGTMIIDQVYAGKQILYCDKPISYRNGKIFVEN